MISIKSEDVFEASKKFADEQGTGPIRYAFEQGAKFVWLWYRQNSQPNRELCPCCCFNPLILSKDYCSKCGKDMR